MPVGLQSGDRHRLLAALLAVMAVVVLASGRPRETVALAPPATALVTDPAAEPLLGRTKLDINRATEAQLRLLPRIGPRLAARMVAFRRKRRGLRNLDQLDQVLGIGAATLARIVPLLCLQPLHSRSKSLLKKAGSNEVRAVSCRKD